MVELKGSLDGIGLPAIVQLISELHHSGTLELTHGAGTGLLSFDEGRLVGAAFDDARGPAAVSRIVLELGGGHFHFVEGRPAGEPNLNLAGPELQRLLLDIAAVGVVEAAPATTPEVPAAVAPEICPRLGLVDDSTRRHGRITALHRCYASDAAELVTINEQRELCLSGQYMVCPRFRTPSATLRPPAAPRVDAGAGPGEGAEVVAAPQADTPPAVAARVAAASQMRLSQARVAGPSHKVPADEAMTGQPSRRRLILLACVAVGVIAAVAIGAFALSSFDHGSDTAAPAPLATQVLEPTANPTAIRPAGPTVSVAGSNATAAPSPSAPTVAAALAVPSPTVNPTQLPPRAIAVAAPSPSVTGTAIPRPGPALLDVDFGSALPPGWLVSAPYAEWVDGAYRLRARQAARFVAVRTPPAAVPNDLVVSATFRKTGGPPGGGYGIIVRDNGPEPRDGVNQMLNGYVFETGDLGEFGIWRRENDHWVDLVPWTRSAAVRVGGSPNELVVRAVSDQFVFTVNGNELATVRDATLAGGAAGVFSGGDFNEVALDHFAVQPLIP